jgi:hypothetical protein
MANKNAAKFAADREKRRTPKAPRTDTGAGRERNVAHKKSEEHSRVGKRKRG